jgi:hypothetical protein
VADEGGIGYHQGVVSRAGVLLAPIRIRAGDARGRVVVVTVETLAMVGCTRMWPAAQSPEHVPAPAAEIAVATPAALGSPLPSPGSAGHAIAHTAETSLADAAGMLNQHVFLGAGTALIAVNLAGIAP